MPWFSMNVYFFQNAWACRIQPLLQAGTSTRQLMARSRDDRKQVGVVSFARQSWLNSDMVRTRIL